MVILDPEQRPERQHCGRRMCAICRRIKRDKGNQCDYLFLINFITSIAGNRTKNLCYLFIFFWYH